MHYYNEFDKKTAAWLRELIAQGHLPKGHVDDRSIADVQPGDLDGYVQCHFFAGIGGWPYALQLAGWPANEPVWTGSCPCQPFSVAGKGLGTKDERHLWPEMFRLIRECKPTTVFGEQVASKAGREWLAGVFADLEGMGYAAAGADLCAAGVGAPHIRQRLFWVAQSEGGCGWSLQQREWEAIPDTCGTVKANRRLADGNINGSHRAHGPAAQPDGHRQDWWVYIGGDDVGVLPSFWSDYDIAPFCDGKARRVEPGTFPLAHGVSNRVVKLCGFGNAIVPQVAAEFIRAVMESL